MASSNYFSGPNYGAQVGVNHGTINYMYTHEMLIESHGLHNREMNAFDVLFDHTKFPPFHHFVGRDWELAEIRKHLHPVNRIVILQGISGIGKSQIALAYAIKHARKSRAVDRTTVTPENEYGAIFWLDASSERRLMSSFLGIASRICDNHHSFTHLQAIVEEGNAVAAVDAVKRWLSLNMNDRWLLVYDGYNIQEDAFGLQPRAFDLQAFLPQVPQGDIIVTTNNPDVEITGQSIRVQSLTDIRQCVKILSLVSQRPTAMQDPEAYKLAEELGGMPCALDSAGRYLSSNESSISYKDYLKLYREEWQQSQTFIGAPKRPASITWEIALAQIRQENEEAFELAISWVFFDHQDLWRELLLPVPGCSKFINFAELEDVHSFNEVMRTLCRYGFVEIGPDLSIHAQNSRGYSMHKYVHSWMTSALYDKESQVSVELPDSLDFLRDMAKYSFSMASKGPADCFRFLPHADRCLYLISKGFMEPSEDDTLFYQRTINLLSSYYLYASEWVSSAYGSADSNNINFRKPRVSYWRTS
ncbi:unnamed protein product [Penicillium camemberti]|uniref:Str. FM013 n=1 Tax=Penicillium camemberti (strain FM 013) TaxID=1429867 RepID=A0A0G4PLJ9_PENC3|nr:unnamed protein product [Penicillium camemberti]